MEGCPGEVPVLALLLYYALVELSFFITDLDFIIKNSFKVYEFRMLLLFALWSPSKDCVSAMAELGHPAHTLPNLILAHILFSASEGPGLLCRWMWVLYFHVPLLPFTVAPSLPWTSCLPEIGVHGPTGICYSLLSVSPYATV